jgi:hypothetical protein
LTTHPETWSRALLSVLVAIGLVACVSSGMTCDQREGTVADVFDADDLHASPQVALAAFLDRQARFRERSIRENEVGSDTASWSFFDDAGRTVAEARAERTEGGWAAVHWQYCRGR